jgi:hypothetical protein
VVAIEPGTTEWQMTVCFLYKKVMPEFQKNLKNAGPFGGNTETLG